MVAVSCSSVHGLLIWWLYPAVQFRICELGGCIMQFSSGFVNMVAVSCSSVQGL